MHHTWAFWNILFLVHFQFHQIPFPLTLLRSRWWRKHPHRKRKIARFIFFVGRSLYSSKNNKLQNAVNKQTHTSLYIHGKKKKKTCQRWWVGSLAWQIEASPATRCLLCLVLLPVCQLSSRWLSNPQALVCLAHTGRQVKSEQDRKEVDAIARCCCCSDFTGKPPLEKLSGFFLRLCW